ncbi:MAG: dienelactone hydrolase family protein, partial [Pseudomonadota bacterium]
FASQGQSVYDLFFAVVRSTKGCKLMRMSGALVAIAIAIGTASAHAQRTELVSIPTSDGTALKAYVMRPSGYEKRSPAVIALHGCSGPLRRNRQRLSSRHRAWGRILSNAGYLVVFPDSFGSRGHGSLCKVRPRPVRHKDRVQDVQSTILWLKSRRNVDKNAIGLIGWSNGGTTALHVSTRSFSSSLRQIISFYPGCRRLLRRSLGPPKTKLGIIMGAADNWTPPGSCLSLAKNWNIPIKLYEGAYHGFDSPRSRVRVRKGLAFTPGNSGQAHVGTHYQARREAIARVLSILAAELRQ